MKAIIFNFKSEKLHSIEAEEMGIDKHMVASLCRLGNNAISMSLVSNSFSCMDISSFGSPLPNTLIARRLELQTPNMCCGFPQA